MSTRNRKAIVIALIAIIVASFFALFIFPGEYEPYFATAGGAAVIILSWVFMFLREED